MLMDILARSSATKDTAFVLMTEEFQISPLSPDLAPSVQVQGNSELTYSYSMIFYIAQDFNFSTICSEFALQSNLSLQTPL